MYDYLTMIIGAHVELLYQEMGIALGSLISGCSYSDPELRVHFFAPVIQENVDSIQAVIAAHNPAGLTPVQELEGLIAPSKAQLTANGSQLRRITPDQAEQWITNNVTDLTSAKTALIRIARVLVYLLQHAELRGE
jgi:hypothetical protein